MNRKATTTPTTIISTALPTTIDMYVEDEAQKKMNNKITKEMDLHKFSPLNIPVMQKS